MCCRYASAIVCAVVCTHVNMETHTSPPHTHVYSPPPRTHVYSLLPYTAESPCTGKTTKTTTKPTTHTSPRDDHHTTPHTSPFTSATPPPMPWLMPPPPTIPIPPPLTDQFMDTSPCFSPAAKRSRTPPPDPRGAPYKRRSMRLDGEDGVLQERVPLYKASPKYQASPTYKASPGQEVLLPPTHHSSHAHNDDVYGDGAYGGECDVMGEVSLWLQGRSVLDGCEQDHMVCGYECRPVLYCCCAHTHTLTPHTHTHPRPPPPPIPPPPSVYYTPVMTLPPLPPTNNPCCTPPVATHQAMQEQSPHSPCRPCIVVLCCHPCHWRICCVWTT